MKIGMLSQIPRTPAGLKVGWWWLVFGSQPSGALVVVAVRAAIHIYSHSLDSDDFITWIDRQVPSVETSLSTSALSSSSGLGAPSLNKDFTVKYTGGPLGMGMRDK